MRSPIDPTRKVRIDARPEPFELVPANTALVVVDLQNGYASPGGCRHLVGQDIDPARVARRGACGWSDCDHAQERMGRRAQDCWRPELAELA